MHSCSAEHMNAIAKSLGPYTDRINLTTFGSPAMISEDKYRRVKNVINPTDPIPLLGHVQYLKASFTKPEHVEIYRK